MQADIQFTLGSSSCPWANASAAGPGCTWSAQSWRQGSRLIGGLDLVVVREAANLRQKLEHCQEIDVAIEVTGGAFRGKPLTSPQTSERPGDCAPTLLRVSRPSLYSHPSFSHTSLSENFQIYYSFRRDPAACYQGFSPCRADQRLLLPKDLRCLGFIVGRIVLPGAQHVPQSTCYRFGMIFVPCLPAKL